MELSDLASVSGKGGLFRIVKPTRSGVILESLDEKKAKMVATTHHRVSALNEISIYTHSEEGSTPLQEIFVKINEEFEDDPGVDSSSSNEELKSFMQYILPDYDTDRVYVSDIKRLVSWYKIIYTQAPEILQPSKDSEEPKEETDS